MTKLSVHDLLKQLVEHYHFLYEHDRSGLTETRKALVRAEEVNKRVVQQDILPVFSKSLYSIDKPVRSLKHFGKNFCRLRDASIQRGLYVEALLRVLEVGRINYNQQLASFIREHSPKEYRFVDFASSNFRDRADFNRLKKQISSGRFYKRFENDSLRPEDVIKLYKFEILRQTKDSRIDHEKMLAQTYFNITEDDSLSMLSENINLLAHRNTDLHLDDSVESPFFKDVSTSLHLEDLEEKLGKF